MAANFKPSSFIPKEPTQGKQSQGKKSDKGTHINFFLLIGSIIFIVALLLTGGIFAYKQYLESTLADQKQQLEEAKAAFEPELISELSRLDKRLSVGQELLSQHVAATPVFTLLSENMLQTVQLLSFEMNRNQEGHMEIQTSGVATGFPAIALQSDVFGSNSVIQSPVFSDFSSVGSDRIEFELSFTVDKSVASYQNTVE